MRWRSECSADLAWHNMQGIPAVDSAVWGPGVERRTPVNMVRQLREQRELPGADETGRSTRSLRSGSRPASPSRRLPPPWEVPWQKFWGKRGSSLMEMRAGEAAGRDEMSRSPSTRPSSPLKVDSRSARLNGRRSRGEEFRRQDPSPQARDPSPSSPLFRVSWDPYTGRLGSAHVVHESRAESEGCTLKCNSEPLWAQIERNSSCILNNFSRTSRQNGRSRSRGMSSRRRSSRSRSSRTEAEEEHERQEEVKPGY